TEISSRIGYASSINDFNKCGLIFEAIVENLESKQSLFSKLENIVPAACILATNTSSLSVTSIASACTDSGRVIGVHFFNPAPLMPLVEIIRGVETNSTIVEETNQII